MDINRAAFAFNPVVVAPSYNNGGTVARVLADVAGHGLPIIVVNDGSTDATAETLAGFRRQFGFERVQVLTHDRNRGKAAALRTGFAAARAAGYTHALTIDTDGQHDAAFIPVLLDAARWSPDALVIGVRDDLHPDYPARSRVGRRLSNLFVRLECGLRVSDSQCGLRVYPLELLRAARGRAGRFDYETEIITRTGWAGGRILEVPISTVYLPPGERVSHYRPWRDSLRGIALHARLLGRALLPLPHPKLSNRAAPPELKSWPREFLKWLNPLRAWRELRHGQVGRTEIAASLSVGVFVANLPTYPFQTLLSIYVARRLHLNPLAAVAGSTVSTPPLGMLLVAAAVYVGHVLLHGSAPSMPDLHSVQSAWRTLGRPLLIDWAVGGALIGATLAAIVFVLARAVFRDAGFFSLTLRERAGVRGNRRRLSSRPHPNPLPEGEGEEGARANASSTPIETPLQEARSPI